MAAAKKLYRKRDSALAGVCSGLADYFDADVLVVRILAVLVTLATFSLGAFFYLIMGAVVPLEPARAVPYEVLPENATSAIHGDKPSAPVRTAGDARQPPTINSGSRIGMAVALVLLFFFASFNFAPMVPGTNWWQFWPLAPLIVGLLLIVIPVRTTYEGAWHALGIVIAALAAMLVPLSLGIISWETLPLGLQRFWWLLVAAVAMFAFGMKRNSLALMMAGALCIVIFCLCALYFCAVPGVMSSFVLVMPGGRSIAIMGHLTHQGAFSIGLPFTGC